MHTGTVRPLPTNVARPLLGYAGGAVAVLALFLILLGSSTVQAGHVGVLTTWGKVSPGVLQPGFHLVMPVAQKITQVDVRVQPHNFNQIDAASRELQSVKLTGTMNYHLDSPRVNELFQTVGLDFANKTVDPAFSDFIKEVVPTYSVTDILAKRDEIRAKAREKLGANLARYGIIVDDIYISNIRFSSDYEGAIEAKQTAAQNVEKEKQILAQKQIQAQQQVVDAQGQAEANRVRAQFLSRELIDYLMIQKWDGKMPQVTGNASPFVSVTQR